MSSSFRRPGKKATARSRPAPSAPAESPASSTPLDSSPTASSITSATDSVSELSITRQHRNPHAHNTRRPHLPGTKPWTNNLTLTSFGLREIDSFMFSSTAGSNAGGGGGGGGQPLQTLVILEEDRLTDDLARALCRYWCAEGVAQGQMVVLGAMRPLLEHTFDNLNDAADKCVNSEGSSPEELQEFVMSLPKNLHLEKFRSKMEKQTAPSTKETNDPLYAESFAIIEEQNESDNDEDERCDNIKGSESNDASTDEGLKIAWQYRKSVQDARSGVAGDGNSRSDAGDGIYCHSYDLSKRMWDQFANLGDNPLLTNTKVVNCWKAFRGSLSVVDFRKQGMNLFCTLWKHIQSTFSEYDRNRNQEGESKPSTVIRLFLHRLPVGPGSVAMPLLIAKIRKENLPVVVLVTIRPWRWLTSNTAQSCGSNKIDTLSSLRSSSDVTLSLDSFASLRTPPPPEFQLLQGILTIRKCAPFTLSHYTDTITSKRPLSERFGVKRDGRKLTVQLLHLPPEEFSRAGGSVGSGARSGGGNGEASFDSEKGMVSAGLSISGSHGGCGSSKLGSGGPLDF
ncbi:hypothetical protein ACHAXS_011940 [Conticribra weissflogii]